MWCDIRWLRGKCGVVHDCMLLEGGKTDEGSGGAKVDFSV